MAGPASASLLCTSEVQLSVLVKLALQKLQLRLLVLVIVSGALW